MKRLLYVDCCIRGRASRTRQLGEAFLTALPADWSVSRLELMREDLHCLQGEFFEARQSLLERGLRNHPRFRYAWQFAQADGIVVAAPFWDLSFPALLKVYVENISVEGITFGCDAQGCYGICHAQRLALLTTRGGCYADSPLEMGSRYWEALCHLFGIGGFDCVAADGLDAQGAASAAILAEACRRAVELAQIF